MTNTAASSASYRPAWNRRRRCQLPPACYCTDWHRAQQPLNGGTDPVRGVGGVFHPQRTGNLLFKQLGIRLAGRIRQCICQQIECEVGVRGGCPARLLVWQWKGISSVARALARQIPDDVPRHRAVHGQGAGMGCQIHQRNGRPIVGRYACGRSIFT